MLGRVLAEAPMSKTDALRCGGDVHTGQEPGSEASPWSIPPPSARSGGGAMRIESRWEGAERTGASITAAKSAAD